MLVDVTLLYLQLSVCDLADGGTSHKIWLGALSPWCWCCFTKLYFEVKIKNRHSMSVDVLLWLKVRLTTKGKRSVSNDTAVDSIVVAAYNFEMSFADTLSFSSIDIRDKAPIKNLYRELKDLERQLAVSGDNKVVAASGSLESGVSIGAVVDMEGVKAEKKRVKREIQAWLEDFEAREGRPARQEWVFCFA